MILFSLGLLSTNLERVQTTYFNVKYAALKKKDKRDDKIFPYFFNYFLKENKQSPEIWQCCFKYILLFACTYSKSRIAH